MNSTDKKFQEMSQCWRRVALTQGVPATMVGAAQQSEMWNDAIERAVANIDSLAAEGSGASDNPSYQVCMMKQPSKSRAFSPRFAIVAAALTAATSAGMRRELTAPKAAAFVIQVPSIGWIAPLKGYLRELDDKLLIIARDGSNRTQDTPAVGNDEVSSALSQGRRVVGIAVNPDTTLPSTLIATADYNVKLEAPSGRVVRDAMRRCYSRGVPDKVDDVLVAGLELEDLVAVMRKGSRPSDVLKRLYDASRRRNNVDIAERLPKLEDAIEYGAARTWGLALAKDFSDYRAGKIQWADVSRGAVIHSKEPGLGKSMFAKMLANACQVPLINASVGELFANSAGFLDSVIKSLRAVMTRAAAISPCIVHWEELDGFPNRATLSPRGADWWLPVIEDFMCQLDSTIATREGICVIGSTNRIIAIDPAIMRPGRLEVAIQIQRPDAAGIANILNFHLDGNLPGIDLTGFATMLVGSTGADIMLVTRNARRLARQAGRDLIEDDLIGAILPAETIPPAALRRMTVHEASHAVVALATGAGRVAYCRVQSNADEAGRTAISYDCGDYLTLPAIERKVVGFLAGRAGERLLIGAESDGSGGFDGSDLARSTATIAALYISNGLGGKLVYRGDEKDALREVRRDRRLRATVERHLQELHARAEALVYENREAIAAVADELTTKRFLSGAAIEAIMARWKPKKAALAGRQAKSIRN
jgi:cell division protease FtsH